MEGTLVLKLDLVLQRGAGMAALPQPWPQRLQARAAMGGVVCCLPLFTLTGVKRGQGSVD